MPHQQVQQTAMNSGYAPGYPQFQSNPMNMSQAPQPMYTATHAPQQMMHPSTHTPPFNPSSPINSPPQQLGHAAWYYHGHHQQDTNDFILYPPGTFPPQSPPSVGGPIGSDHSSSPPGHSPPGHYTTAHNISPYQQQHIPYSSAEHAIIPGVARVDSLNSFLQEVFPDVPRSRAVMDEPYTEITEDRPRAMPSSEIAEMNRNMALQEAEQTRSLNETLSTRPSFLVRVKLNRLEMAERYHPQPITPSGSTTNDNELHRGKSFLRSWSLRAPNQESLPPTEPPRHDDGRPSFWKRFSAPARLAGVEPVMSAAREPESQNDGPVLGGIKRILSFGLTRPKSAVSAVDKTPAAKPPIENSATAKINSMAADPDAETAAKPPVDADVAAKPLVAAEPPTITTAATSIPTPPNSP